MNKAKHRRQSWKDGVRACASQCIQTFAPQQPRSINSEVQSDDPLGSSVL